jgi:hypothetical protein
MSAGTQQAKSGPNRRRNGWGQATIPRQKYRGAGKAFRAGGCPQTEMSPQLYNPEKSPK